MNISNPGDIIHKLVLTDTKRRYAPHEHSHSFISFPPKYLVRFRRIYAHIVASERVGTPIDI